MTSFTIIDYCVHFDQVLAHRHRHKNTTGKKVYNTTRMDIIILRKMAEGTSSAKTITSYLSSLHRDTTPVHILKSLHSLLKFRYCTRQRYGIAYYYKITAAGIALLSAIEQELSDIVNGTK